MGKSIIIGNREYDSVTGLPLSDSTGRGDVRHISRRELRTVSRQQMQKPQVKKPAVSRQQVRPAHTVHGKMQKSTTLNRAYIKSKPATKAPVAHAMPISDVAPVTMTTPEQAVAPVVEEPRLSATATITKRNTKMVDGVRAPHKRSLVRYSKQTNNDSVTTVSEDKSHNDNLVVTEHPIAKKVSDTQKLRKHEVEKQQLSSRHTPASVLKQTKVEEALNNAPRHHAKQNKLGFKYRTKLMSFGFGAMALMMLGGYMTYINAPNISVRIAAAQAGIDASYPSYKPDGYSLNGPVAFNDGEVSMNFVANANKEVSYYVQQSSSSWDSATLLENYVKGQSGGDYSTSQLNGMTIYTYGGNAAWVSGGIMYTINGNAQLSPDQLRKIASSLS